MKKLILALFLATFLVSPVSAQVDLTPDTRAALIAEISAKLTELYQQLISALSEQIADQTTKLSRIEEKIDRQRENDEEDDTTPVVSTPAPQVIEYLVTSSAGPTSDSVRVEGQGGKTIFRGIYVNVSNFLPDRDEVEVRFFNNDTNEEIAKKEQEFARSCNEPNQEERVKKNLGCLVKFIFPVPLEEATYRIETSVNGEEKTSHIKIKSRESLGINNRCNLVALEDLESDCIRRLVPGGGGNNWKVSH